MGSFSFYKDIRGRGLYPKEMFSDENDANLYRRYAGSILIPSSEVEEGLSHMASWVSGRYSNADLIIIPVLTGGLFVYEDLTQYLKVGHLPDNKWRASSYGGSTESSGTVIITYDGKPPEQSFQAGRYNGSCVLVIDDIADTQLTRNELSRIIRNKNPGISSLEFAVLLCKPAKNLTEGNVNYSSFLIDDHFVVGRGMGGPEEMGELAEKSRYCRDIWVFQSRAQ